VPSVQQSTRSRKARRGSERRAAWLRAPSIVLDRLGWGLRDAIACAVGTAAAVAILINALFLQSGPHPAPLFKTTLASLPSGDATNALPAPRSSSTASVPLKSDAGAPPLPPRRPDPIGDLLNSSKRIMAIQRALAQFGYGQIRATGVVDAETRAAIEKFERESRLPVTGQPSELVAQKLFEMTDRPLN
jgi:hypothetical protein